VSSYIGNILVQEAGQGSGSNVKNIFDATLMQAAGNRNKLNVERNGKNVTKELAEGAVGVEAKEESNEFPVEGANANDKETWVFLGKPMVGGTKEPEKGAIGVEVKEVSDKLPVEGLDAQRSLIPHFPSQPHWSVADLIQWIQPFLLPL
jgi:hypothetical protein